MNDRIWASTLDVATAAEEVARMSREQIVARLTFLMPALTDGGLRAVAVVAMTAEQRPLDREALGDAQREREQRPDAQPQAVEVVRAPPRSRWVGDPPDPTPSGCDGGHPGCTVCDSIAAAPHVVGTIDGEPVFVRGGDR